MITDRSNLGVPISSTLSGTISNISGIRTRAIEILNVFEMEFLYEKDISKMMLMCRILSLRHKNENPVSSLVTFCFCDVVIKNDT